MSQAFEDWIALARSVPVLDAVSMLGGKVKRHGKEYHGPCPAGCAQKDGFIVWPDRNNFLCRPTGETGSVIDLVMHVTGHDFKGACEFLTGTPPPNGRSGGIDEAARKRLQKRQEEQEQLRVSQEREEERKARYKRQNARGYWWDRVSPAGTVAETYALSRCISQIDQIPALGYHGAVYNEDVKKNHRALLGCVVGPDQKFRGIWRIFLNQEGKKAPVPYVKKGLGKPEGGSVWIADREQMKETVWGICEGIETALAIRELDKLPVFAALSTSGMKSFQVPEFVTHLQIYADGDLPYRNKDGVWQNPPGMHAAQGLSARLKEINLSHSIVEPPQDGDWNDVLVNAKEAGLV